MLLLLFTLLVSAFANLPPEDVAAPEIDFGHWISQGPAVEPQAGQLTVVELWATWCGPCHETFPKLTTLQADYGDRIRVVALTDDRPERVRKFFHEHREQMRFGIAVTDSETVQSLMFGGFGGRALPSVYVMRDGRMLWSGHPDELEAALSEWVAEDEEGWQASSLRLPAGGTAPLVFNLAIPDGFDVKPESVDVQVLDAGSLQTGEPVVRSRSTTSSERVTIEIQIGAGGLSNTDTPVSVEIGHHVCQDGTCFPRQTQAVQAVVHVTGA